MFNIGNMLLFIDALNENYSYKYSNKNKKKKSILFRMREISISNHGTAETGNM